MTVERLILVLIISYGVWFLMNKAKGVTALPGHILRKCFTLPSTRREQKEKALELARQKKLERKEIIRAGRDLHLSIRRMSPLLKGIKISKVLLASEDYLISIDRVIPAGSGEIRKALAEAIIRKEGGSINITVLNHSITPIQISTIPYSDRGVNGAALIMSNVVRRRIKRVS